MLAHRTIVRRSAPSLAQLLGGHAGGSVDNVNNGVPAHARDIKHELELFNLCFAWIYWR